MVHFMFKPVEGIWDLAAGLLALTGRLLAGILGLVFIGIGVLLTLTVVGAIAGIPLLLLGILLLVRCLF